MYCIVCGKTAFKDLPLVQATDISSDETKVIYAHWPVCTQFLYCNLPHQQGILIRRQFEQDAKQQGLL